MLDETTTPTSGDAGEPTGGAEARFTQADLDRIDAKNRRKVKELQAQLEQLSAKEAERTEAAKSEEQKRLEQAIKKAADERDQHWTQQLTAREIDSELRVKLIEGGYDPDLAHLVKAKGEIGTLDDIPGAISDALAGKEWAKQKLPGQPGRPTAAPKDGMPKTLDEYNAFVAQNGIGAVTPEMYTKVKAMLRGR